MNLRFPAAVLLVFSVMADAQDRMPPIPADKLTPAQKHSVELLAATPRGAGAGGGPFVPLLRSPELMDRLQAVGEYLRYKNSVPQKLVEMAIIMTARQSMQQYEWNSHYPLALKAGLPVETANAIAVGRRPDSLAADEEIVYNFTAELLQNKSVSDATYGRMLAKFGEQGVVDTTGLVGYYSTLALILNVARSPAQPESTAPKLAPFPR
ncbi:MAG: carboxymuconolactone decarboxylase family protein [Acidobacteriota bacterium]|nr:carboxymuconolactone decarboxylase family protein [Acidobacteriota bacterium]